MIRLSGLPDSEQYLGVGAVQLRTDACNGLLGWEQIIIGKSIPPESFTRRLGDPTTCKMVPGSLRDIGSSNCGDPWGSKVTPWVPKVPQGCQK